MKKKNEYTKKDVKRRAYALIYSIDNLLCLRPFARLRLDMRYNFNKEVAAFFHAKNLPDNERRAVLAKRKKRRDNKPPKFSNVLNTPLVKDYFRNKSGLKGVADNHLYFWDGRNHWAKSDKDRRILAILKKNFRG